EEEEQDLGDPGGRHGDAAEAEERGHQRNDEKHQCPIEHDNSFHHSARGALGEISSPGAFAGLPPANRCICTRRARPMSPPRAGGGAGDRAGALVESPDSTPPEVVLFTSAIRAHCPGFPSTHRTDPTAIPAHRCRRARSCASGTVLAEAKASGTHAKPGWALGCART